MTTLSGISLRFTGRVDALSLEDRRALIDRTVSQDSSIRDAVSRIIESVRTRGDAALLDLARELDRVELTCIEVPSTRIDAALTALSPTLRSAMSRAARNIERVHAAQMPRESTVDVEPGVTVVRRPDPLERVGIYAPGGTASYFSSVLMCAIPARIAGVREIVMCTPPLNDGFPAPELLAAAAIAGVDRVFSIGGAGAIAAMATGTETIPRVDRIVGPGNAYVAEAKMQLASVVGIDSQAGPSELLVIADETASSEMIAREVVAQAEHDVRATVIVVAIGSATAANIENSLNDLVPSQSRSEIVVEALSQRGGIVVADSTNEAIELSNAFAPEHLLIASRGADELAARARNAGSVFVGETSSVAFGDYITGGNHVLPTGGTGRWYSGLSTLEFVRWTTVQRVSRSAALALSADTALLAETEGLPAHAGAALQWGSEP
jgi:histidinol dehydrogenase